MSLKYLYQIVLCSQREGRCFRREIAVSAADALIVKAEIMPPGYHIALMRMRPENDEVQEFPFAARMSDDYNGCPLCGQPCIFECRNCGMLSCASDYSGHHWCPGCERICDVQTARRFRASNSGWVHGQPRQIDYGFGISTPGVSAPKPKTKPEPGPLPESVRRAREMKQKQIGGGKSLLQKWLEGKKKE